MIVFKHARNLDSYIDSQKKRGATIGFVPTMGALHAGHLSLIQSSKTACGLTVCSIFVNPTQFNDPKDFEKYPVTIEKDLLMLEQAGTDVLFLPSVQEIYPTGLNTKVHYDLGYLETILEGEYRPGHFQGVCQVVHTLLAMVKPDIVFFGRKDYQQCMVVKKLITLYNLPVVMQTGETLREPDGLAMSSRNLRLNPESRKKAVAVYQALSYTKQNVHTQPVALLKAHAVQMLVDAGFGPVDYVEICDADTLLPVGDEVGTGRLVALVAAFLNGVRLIDNMFV